MSSPPQTPLHGLSSAHRRNPSSLDMSHTASSSKRNSFRRRSSGYSSITPRLSQEFDSPAHNFDGGGDGGLGNLADELGELDDWDEDEDGVGGEYEDDMDLPHEGENDVGVAVDHDGSVGAVNGVRDSGVAMQSSSPAPSGLSPQSAVKNRKHQRQHSLYDGSDYGDDSDLEADEGISPALENRMAAIESLARRGIEENGSATDGVVMRVTEQLRDLGSQIGIENGATRLKTAHDALTTHLTHQSRTLTSATAVMTGPRAIMPPAEEIEVLLPMIESTLELIPHASPQVLVALSQLTHSTRELLEHFSNVSDSLHMSRQKALEANRRLRSSKDQLAEWKKDMDAKEFGIQFIESGNWDRRLREREAGAACGDVVSGFEEQCGLWRKKLCEGLGVASA
ncbi:hypothetical protein BU23DRAFT_505162 [Bimuria novae-zelandiae CBS 107.79]|uniref:Uncharacterized protein n=1 Tax=Bimuria novae-zelandiae CBS 107.79 TaxID=1447943 RepID=A0A6A5VAV0_9PLEO|nr:hypothetical protein BU23DRAFT_505162 [Bimuria novae-zelandiae CBS 107.79]